MGLLQKHKNADTTFLHSHDEIPLAYGAFLPWNYLALVIENNLPRGATCIWIWISSS